MDSEGYIYIYLTIHGGRERGEVHNNKATKEASNLGVGIREVGGGVLGGVEGGRGEVM